MDFASEGPFAKGAKIATLESWPARAGLVRDGGRNDSNALQFAGGNRSGGAGAGAIFQARGTAVAAGTCSRSGRPLSRPPLGNGWAVCVELRVPAGRATAF